MAGLIAVEPGAGAAPAAQPAPAEPMPRAPRSVAETGVSPVYLDELALKTIHNAGPSTLDELMRRMGLSLPVVQEVKERLTRRGLIEAAGIPGYAGPDYSTFGYRFSLSERGEQRVAAALQRSRYVGLAPVPIEQYADLARVQSLRACPATADQIYDALSPFVLQSIVRRALARAFHAGRPALIYGDTGKGKTSIVDAYARSFGQAVWIPAALYAHGHTIRVYDSAVHHQIEPEAAPADEAPAANGRRPIDLLRAESGPPDRRWLRVRRPVVSVGGELVAQHLELAYDAEGGYYQAPPHVQAQDGILIIDDFGRQRLRPEDLLDRWIVPLERGYDLLSLDAGERLLVPFETCVLFSTNLSPTDLADEALLRRIPYKVNIPNPNGQEIAEITRRECDRRGLTVSPAAIDSLVKALFRPGQPTPKGVFPRDLLSIIEDGARFDGAAPELTPEAIEDACQVYFVSEDVRR